MPLAVPPRLLFTPFGSLLTTLCRHLIWNCAGTV